MLYPNGLKTRPIVSSPYGWRIHPITGKRAFHYGTDSYGHPGGWNRAPEAGVVVWAGYNGGEGLSVHIQGATRKWKLFHHARIDVAVGQRIAEGGITGPTGTTGASTGIHCHTECWAGSSSEDAYAYIAAHLHDAAGGGGSGIIDRQEGSTVNLYHKLGSSPTLYALAGGSPGTPANWLETQDQNFANQLSAQIGASSAGLTAGSFEAWKAAYLAPVKVGGLSVGDVTIEAKGDPAMLAALTKIAEGQADVLKAVKALNPPG